ncbi:MAG TPA: lactate racemase domain-containing protein [Pyrinomonadaceae bacterium]|nr:lactate racemase domain-containing protein [Pyrinomonadaceae bacterium]
MIEISAPSLIGQGSVDCDLSTAEVTAIVKEALSPVDKGERVLAIIPDKTRDDNTHVLFPLAGEILKRQNIAQFDALVAQGTHPTMTESQKRMKIGAVNGEIPGLGRIFDHQWDRPDELVKLAQLSSAQVGALTDSLINEPVDIRLNALLAPGVYDTVLVFGATVPHEVAGFAGGAKYFFPGVAGPELTHMTHWLGALATIELVIGRVETPIRRMIEAAAEFVPARVISFTSVTTRDSSNDEGLRTHALFAGDVKETLRAAAEISKQVHIKYTGRRYRRVVALLDEHYDELWVGGKASYKLGSIIEEGGELIIYAPHLENISATHGRLIEKYGYAPLETVREMVEYSDELRANLCVAAHLAHVSYGSSRNQQGGIIPRYRITLCSAVPEEVCRRVKLGYLDHQTFRREVYEADPETLVVEHAGRDLYLVEPNI